MVEAAEALARARALAAAGDGSGALALGGAGLARRLVQPRRHRRGCRAAAAAALGAPGAEPASVDRARVLYADHLFAFRTGDQERARAQAEQCLLVAREAGDLRGECDGLTGLARSALRDGDYARVADEGRAKAQAAGDRGAEASPLHLEAAGTRLGDDHRRAQTLYAESLELARELGNAGAVANELHDLGWVAIHLGDVDAAESRFDEFEQAANAAHHRPWLELDRAGVAGARGNLDEARARLAAGGGADLGGRTDPRSRRPVRARLAPRAGLPLTGETGATGLEPAFGLYVGRL